MTSGAGDRRPRRTRFSLPTSVETATLASQSLGIWRLRSMSSWRDTHQTAMRRFAIALAALVMSFAGTRTATAQTGQSPAIATRENFARAQTDFYFTQTVRAGGFGKLVHARTMVPVNRQGVVRMNRDTLYSSGSFDLAAGPVTITLPEPGRRYMSLQVISEQRDGGTNRRRLCDRPVRWLQPGHRQLPADHAGLELHRPPLPAAPRGAERRLGLSQTTAGRVTRLRWRDGQGPNWGTKSSPRRRAEGPLLVQ
jgi:Protein of unknown function (DUF1254)